MLWVSSFFLEDEGRLMELRYGNYLKKNTMFGSDLFEANYPRFLSMQLNAEG